MLPIEESVGLLAKFDPRTLENLRSRFPESANILKPGQVAGEVEDRKRLAAEITISACDKASELSDDLASFLKSRLDLSSRLEYLAQFISLLTSGSLLGLLSSGAPLVAKYTVAVLSFVSSIASLAAKYFSRTFTTGASSAPDIFTELLEIKPAAEALRTQVRLWLLDDNPARVDEIDALTAKGNALAGKIYKLTAVVPGFAEKAKAR